MLHKMTTINCIIFEWLILLFAFKQGNGDSVCNLFVTKTSKSWNGKALNISLDPSKWGTINNDVRSCTVDISFSDFFIVRFMKVNMTNSQNSTSYPNPACFFIYKYEFLVYEDMKPIKKYDCLSTHGYWCLPPSWTNGHEFIDVVVTSSSSSREDNNTYEVLVSTNSSRPFGIDCVYEQTTTTTSTTTTTTTTTTSVATQSPWSQWSPWSTDIVYGKTTPKTSMFRIS
ncbi:hypothetical protein KUTeg_005561 [Tegillarca granosa]|uniref:Uncharacterized protein n=1 Tax=Tegillarca granosa TaxID=220873 RepID=A0ABQ9FLY9_TEGGR|nr:hypothetical protein KUTeg_005561 [Tegillarca granosa]